MRFLTGSGTAVVSTIGETSTARTRAPTMSFRRLDSRASIPIDGNNARYDARDSVKTKGTAMSPITPAAHARSFSRFVSRPMPPAMAIISNR